MFGISKTLFWILVLGAWCFSSNGAFIYETPTEFLTSGDFNGDGVPDVLVLDRFTGNARIGYQTNSFLTWFGPLLTGVASPDAMTVGRLRETNRDAIAITSRALNRVQLVSVANPSNSLASMTPHGLGPNFLVSLASPYGSVTNRDWMVVGSADGDPGVTLVELFAFVGDALTFYQDSVAQQAYLSRGNSLRLGVDPATYAAAIQRGSNDQFVAYSASNHFGLVLSRPNLAFGSDYVFGTFNNETLPRFFFYVPGQSNLTIQALIQTNGGFIFNAGVLVSFTQAIQRVFVLEQNGDGSCVVQFGDGVQGLRLPGGTPALAPKYSSGAGAAGNVFTGVVPLNGGNFALLDGPAGSSTATHEQVIHFSGSNYTQLSTGNLPVMTSRSTRANVWLFQTEPFVNSDPNFVASSNAPDWTSSAGISGGVLTVRTETDGGATPGLGSPATNNFGAPPAGAAFAIPDQYQDSISLFTYSSPRPPDPLGVTISPAPGLYGGTIQVGFTRHNITDNIYYRVAPLDTYHIFSLPFLLNTNATLQYFATNALLAARSRLYSATYSFGGASGTSPQPPLDLAPGSTNPAPVFNTNLIILSDVGTVFYGRRAAQSVVGNGFLGPTPYLSFANSPFSNTNRFNYFYLETFEDGFFNVPGANPSAGWAVAGPGSSTDSVDADDGSINGSGSGGHSLYSGGTQTNLTVTFNPAALGGHLPTHVGIVWTDVGVVLSGSVGFGNVSFSARDSNGLPVGSVVGVGLGDGSGGSQTAEDRFFGVVYPGGISSVSITMTNSRDWEVDHLQYGYLDSAGFNGTIWAINLDGSGETYVTQGARPRVSRDGRYLAFLREGSPFSNQGNLWVRDLANGQEARIFTNNTSLVGYDWALTETNLFFDYNCLFWNIGLSGPPSQMPLSQVCGQGAPVVSPTDGRIAFHNVNLNGPGLYLSPPDMSSAQYLSLNAASGHRWPAWSPDGGAIAFADGPFSTVDAGKNLWIVDLGPGNTNQLYQITAFPFSDTTNGFPHGAVWAPDGEALVGAGTVFGTNGIWIIPLDFDCMCSSDFPIRLPTAPGDPIDFVGSIIPAPVAPERIPQPGFFIRQDPNAVVVYWGSIFAGFTLEYTTDLTPPATWQPLPGPYDTDGYFFYYIELLGDLAQKKFFRLHYTGL